MSDKAKETFYNNSNYDPKKFDKDSDKMPTTGAKNGLKLSDMYGKDYDDADWDKLLDQLTFDDMDNLIANGGYGTQAVKSVGKIQLTDADGPASLNNNFTGVGSIGFPASTAFACTWNKDLAKQFGEMIGDMAHDMHVAGWYAPAMNIHRNAFSGRTFEYFSEDSLLSGVMASSEISGAKSKGVYSFMKHFALNDQETKRTEMLCTWTNEQAMREIYLKPFEMSVKEGGAQAVMSSFNYIGNTYAGADSALLHCMASASQPWNVSSLAQSAGVAALTEQDFLQRTRSLVHTERRWLTDNLTALGFWVCPSQANYLLFRGPRGLREGLLRQGIAIRGCENYSGLDDGWYRIAVRPHEENEALITAIRQFCKEKSLWL